MKDYGIDLAIKMIRRLTNEGGVSGFHFCTLNLEKSVRRVLEGLEWIGDNQRTMEQNRLIAVLKSFLCRRRLSLQVFRKHHRWERVHPPLILI